MSDKIPQLAFSSGEVAPSIFGQVNLAKYGTGLSYCNNYNVLVEGGLTKRSGLYFVAETKYSDKFTKLEPFVASVFDSHVLEVGEYYIRVHRFGSPVYMPSGHVAHADSDVISATDEIIEFVTPYTEDQIEDLKFVQSNDVLYVTHPSHPPKTISRYSIYDWGFADAQLTNTLALITGLTATFTTNVGSSGYVNQLTAHNYRVTWTDAEGVESAAVDVSVNADLGYRGNYVTLDWTDITEADYFTIYKGSDDTYGFIGYATVNTFKDDNIAPNYDLTITKFFNPFADGNYPAVAGFSDQRTFYGHTNVNAQRVVSSKANQLNIFSKSVPLKDDDSIDITLTSLKKQSINHFVPHDNLLMFTDNAEWVLGVLGSTGLSAATIDPKPQSYYGSARNIDPITINERILFVQALGHVVRDFGYSLQADRFKADDLSILSRHMFLNRKISDWTFDEHPFSLIRTVMTDGKMLNMVYDREQQVWGWTREETQGLYQSITTVPEFSNTYSYVVVQRKVNGVFKQFIEFTTPDNFEEVEDAFYVDCGLTYDNPLVVSSVVYDDTASTLTITSDAHGLIVGDKIDLSRIEGFVEDLGHENVGDVFDINDRYTITAVTTNTVTVSVTDFPDFYSDYVDDTGFMRKVVTSVTGLDHLEGMENIVALVNGNVVKDVTITSGTFTDDVGFSRLHVGIGYESRADLLPLELGTSSGKRLIKGISGMKVLVENTRGLYYSSNPDTQPYMEYRPRSDEAPYKPNKLINGTIDLDTLTDANADGKFSFKSIDPLPQRINSVVPEVTYHD
jgi:hypothetical protein